MFRFLFPFFFLVTACFGTWSSPVSLSFPQDVNVNDLTGDIDSSGDTVLVWQDPITGHQLSAIYIANSSTWGPVQTVTTDVVVNIGTSINEVGQAVTAWVDSATGNLYSSFNHGSGWGTKKLVYSPPAGVTLFNPQMAIDDTGSVLLAFSDLDGDTTSIYASYYTNGVWMPSLLLNSATGLVVAPLASVLLDQAGNGLIAWGFYDGSTVSTYGAEFIKSTEQITVAPPLGLNQPAEAAFISSNSNYVTTAISPNGQAIVTWTLGTGGVWSSLFLNGSWLPAVEIVGNPHSNNPAQVAINDAGIALIVYASQGVTTTIMAATYDGTSVSFSEVVDTSNFVLALAAAIDQFDNKALAWGDFNFAVGTLFPTLYVATEPVGSNTWSAPAALYVGPVRDVVVTFSLVISPSEKAYLGWAFGPFPNPNLNVSVVNISVGSALFPPQPPSNLKGALVKKQYLLHQDLVHVLTWNLSPDPSTSSYLVYRNGKLIGQVPSNVSSFEDHNRTKGEKDVYRVEASNSAGVSIPITLQFSS